MSVHLSERNPNNKAVLKSVSEYADYIIGIATKDDVIPKSKRYIFAYDLVHMSNSLIGLLSKADKASEYIRYREDYFCMRELQIEACELISNIDILLDRAHNRHHIPEHKIFRAEQLFDIAQKDLNTWIEYDEKKYSRLIG